MSRETQDRDLQVAKFSKQDQKQQKTRKDKSEFFFFKKKKF